jgi:hypothetical protein
MYLAAKTPDGASGSRSAYRLTLFPEVQPLGCDPSSKRLIAGNNH